jgi:dihydrofolate synthase/folylpolyglutamate synthase
MTYAQAVSYLLSVGQELRGVKFDLANISRLLEELGHPERAWPSVHIAGTNGKGSVAAMLEAVLLSAGYRTGLYTSPHLARVNERFRVAGEEISESEFAAVSSDVLAAVERLLASGALAAHPSFFECLTAIGFEHFRRARCGIAVLEVGMGGRLDATNVVTPLVSVITLVDHDHEAYLGQTLEQIAFEKAGIIKEGGVVVSAPQHPEAAAVIERVARERGARLLRADESALERANGRLRLALPGRHQVSNAAMVVAVVEELRRQGWSISPQALAEGLATVRWPGRLEWLEGRPPLLLDGAHNPAGARALRAYLCELLGAPASAAGARRMVLLFGAMRDKAVAEMADLLFPLAAGVVLTRPRQKRAATPQALAEITSHLNPCVMERDDSRAALEAARELAGPDGLVVVTGSLYLVGEIRQLVLECGA